MATDWLPDPKPALSSTTILGSLATILSSLATIAMVWEGTLGPDALGPAVIAIVGAAAAIIGRYRAARPLAGLVRVP